jgi:glycosyltransferase involved in cell wall biosynthesis
MGGAERLMTHLLRHLSQEDFEPRVCVLQQKDGNPVAQDLQRLGVSVDYLPVHHIRDLSAIPRLVRYLKGAGADLVHTQLEFANVLGTLAARLAGIPSVCTIHVLPASDATGKRGFHHKLESFVLSHFSSRVIAVSEQARQLHIAAAGADPGQVITVYNGIDLSGFLNLDRSEARQEARQELGIPQEARVLVTVAVLRPEKGIQFMLRALPQILENDPNAYYMIVGDGSHRQQLLAETEQDSLRGRVIFTGMRGDIARLMAASDIFVLPTLTEALPTVLMEAMAAHLPIVVSAVGGVPEMVQEGRNGLLVPPADVPALVSACSSLLADQSTRLGMGDAGWEVVNRLFSIQGQVDRLREIYLDEIARHGK